MYYGFVDQAHGTTPRSVNNPFPRLRVTNLQEDFVKAAEVAAERDAALYRSVMSRLGRKGTVAKGADEPFVTSLDERVFTGEYEYIAPYGYSRPTSPWNVEKAQLPPFLFYRKHGKLILREDDELLIERQVNRRTRIECFYR